MRNKAVLIIPYFGNIPDYFNLWLKSAEANCEFNFYIYTDLALKVNKNSNVKIKYMTFDFIKQKIKRIFLILLQMIYWIKMKKYFITDILACLRTLPL